MLSITIPAIEQFDEIKQEFVTSKERVIVLEHSLVSVSKWESKHNKPFLTDKAKTYEEMIDYIRCMTITQNVDSSAYRYLSKDNFSDIQSYINAPMTATTFSEHGSKHHGREIVTAEIIYYKMVYHNIPFECQKWHLNRLLTLIRVCDIKAMPPKKMSKAEIAHMYRNLNEKRRTKLNTRG